MSLPNNHYELILDKNIKLVNLIIKNINFVQEVKDSLSQDTFTNRNMNIKNNIDCAFVQNLQQEHSTMSNHHFNVQIAEKYGISVATFLNNLRFWTIINISNNNNFYDGLHWTFNTYESFSEIFPYWTVSQIKNIIKKCLDLNLIIKGNYNKNAYDKTNWYALTDFGLSELHIDKHTIQFTSKQRGQNYLFEETNLADRSDINNQPIPNNKTHIINKDCVGTSRLITHKNFNVDFKKETAEKSSLNDIRAIEYFNAHFNGRDITLADIYNACKEHYEQKGIWVTPERFLRWLKNEKVDNYKKIAKQITKNNDKAELSKLDDSNLLSDYKHWLNRLKGKIPLEKWVPNKQKREKMISIYEKQFNLPMSRNGNITECYT